MEFLGLRRAGDKGDSGILGAGDLRGRGALPATLLEIFRESFGLVTRVYMIDGWLVMMGIFTVDDLD